MNLSGESLKQIRRRIETATSEAAVLQLVAALRGDRRRGARALAEAAERRLRAARRESRRLERLFALRRQLLRAGARAVVQCLAADLAARGVPFGVTRAPRAVLDNEADLVTISPNDPEAMVKYHAECRESGLPYLYDPSQQIVRLSGEDLKAGLEGCDLLVVNEYESCMLREKTGLSDEEIRAMPARACIVTLGEKGTSIWADDEVYEIPAVPPKQILINLMRRLAEQNGGRSVVFDE